MKQPCIFIHSPFHESSDRTSVSVCSSTIQCKRYAAPFDADNEDVQIGDKHFRRLVNEHSQRRPLPKPIFRQFENPLTTVPGAL